MTFGSSPGFFGQNREYALLKPFGLEQASALGQIKERSL